MRISDWSSDVCSSDLPSYLGRTMGAEGLDDFDNADDQEPGYDQVDEGQCRQSRPDEGHEADDDSGDSSDELQPPEPVLVPVGEGVERRREAVDHHEEAKQQDQDAERRPRPAHGADAEQDRGGGLYGRQI